MLSWRNNKNIWLKKGILARAMHLVKSKFLHSLTTFPRYKLVGTFPQVFGMLIKENLFKLIVNGINQGVSVFICFSLGAVWS